MEGLRCPNRKTAVAAIRNGQEIASDLKSQSASEIATKSFSNRELKISTTTTQKARKENLQREALAPSNPTVDMEMLEKTSKTISTIAILWPVKAIFEQRAATVEVDTFISPALSLLTKKG